MFKSEGRRIAALCEPAVPKKLIAQGVLRTCF